MDIKNELTENEAIDLAEQNGHDLLLPKTKGALQIYHCRKSGCNGSIFVDRENDLVFGSALSHVCQDYRGNNFTTSISTKTPYKHIKHDKNDYSYLPDSDWSYDNGVTKKICHECKQPLYRVFKIKKGKRYVGLFCEECKSIYNVGINSFCYKRLTADEKCYTLGEHK